MDGARNPLLIEPLTANALEKSSFCGEFPVDGMAEVAVMLVADCRTDHDLIEDTEIVHEHLRVRVKGKGVS